MTSGTKREETCKRVSERTSSNASVLKEPDEAKRARGRETYGLLGRVRDAGDHSVELGLHGVRLVLDTGELCVLFFWVKGKGGEGGRGKGGQRDLVRRRAGRREGRTMTESRREALLEDTRRGRGGAGVSAGTRRRLEGRRWVALLACHPLTLAPPSAAGVRETPAWRDER